MAQAHALIREARLRSGMTQSELAAAAGTTQSAIARWESGRSIPRFDNVVRVVRECGLDLALSLVEFDADHRRLIEDELGRTPTQRIEDMLARLRLQEALQGMALR